MCNPHDVWYMDTDDYSDICQPMYYDDKNNVMIDADGFPIFNIFDYITPNELFMFKRNKETTMVLSTSGEAFIELVYPEHEGEDPQQFINMMKGDYQ